MYEIFSARNAFAAYLVTSALFSSITMTLLPGCRNGSYRSLRATIARSLLDPITTRSGRRKSSIAYPSRRNSGFDTTSKSNAGPACFRIAACTLSLVPTGTVDLSTTTLYPASGRFAKIFPRSFATCRMYFRSAEPSSPGGVGRHRKTISAGRIAFSRSPENAIRPRFRLRR